MKLVIDRLILKYFNYPLSLPGNTVASQAFLISKSLHERNKVCYLTNLHTILDMYNINDSSRLDKPFSISTLESYDAKMKFEYFTIWKQNLKNSRKLEFYQSFKKRYEAENYLEIIRNFDQRRQLTKFQGPRRGRGWGGFSLPTFLKIIKSY